MKVPFSKVPAYLVMALSVPTAAVLDDGDKSLQTRAGHCNPAWRAVSKDLKLLFKACSDEARSSTRAVFHDCFPGACDGSLLLSAEMQREENALLVPISQTLSEKAAKYKVGKADMIQAAALAIQSCRGPRVRFLAGRADATGPNAEGQLPLADADDATQLRLFRARGFSAEDLVALMGAHSAARLEQGLALDSTPERLDSTVFYAETRDERAPSSLGSDMALAAGNDTRRYWSRFAASQGAWQGAFVVAMSKMMVLGNNVKNLTDCSAYIY
ncbi:hypothetical protein PG997_006376 [Apiospora hydei]|uniref:Peroxidase n=1 Tax=Apiospora hydei TaxID=1337664 RepID=A0ABR1WNJ2_9PEZI